jgi:glycosyltransferase involved in cell wall biosynthesis
MESWHVDPILGNSIALQRGGAESEPLISVVVGVFNGVETLVRCIDSFSKQTYRNRELIIIDGGSEDGTRDLIESNSQHIAHWESERDRGIYHAWNKALQVVHGDWVYFLGADDYFVDDYVLARIAPHLKHRSMDVRVVYGRVNLVRKDGSVIGTFGSQWNREKFFQLMTLPHQGVFHHRSLFQEYGHFNEEFRIAGDYEFLLRDLKSRDPVFIGDVTIAAMQFGGMSSDGRLSIETLREIKRARDLNSIKVIPLSWLWAFIKAHARDFLDRSLGNQWTRVLVNIYRRLTLRRPV